MKISKVSLSVEFFNNKSKKSNVTVIPPEVMAEVMDIVKDMFDPKKEPNPETEKTDSAESQD